MKIVKLKGSKVVEILPQEAYEKGIVHWYGQEFAESCVDAPDDVEQGMVFDGQTFTYPEPTPEPKNDLDRIAELEQLVADLASLALGV